MVVSVDASQGSESDHVILSTVRSNPRGDIGFCADARRSCVALSRARMTLTVVGDTDCMRQGCWEAVIDSAVHEVVSSVPSGDLAEAKGAFDAMRRATLQPCKFFVAGRCSKAECPFLHDAAAPPSAEVLQQLRETAKPCLFFARGECTKGAACTFSHTFDKDDARVKAELRDCQNAREPCQFFAKGRCTKGAACTFSHDFRPGDRAVAAQIRETAEPCQFYAKGKCTKGAACTFSHDFKPGDRGVAAQLRVTAEPCEFFLRGRCTKGARCTFSHALGGPPRGATGRAKGGGKGKR